MLAEVGSSCWRMELSSIEATHCPPIVGTRANSRQMPPAMTVLITRLRNIFGRRLASRMFSTNCFKPIMASSGIVNSATTRMDETVRNFEYSGIWSIKKSVNPWKFFPHERRNERMVATSRTHFSGLRLGTTNRASTKSIQMSAPTYTGPLVPGCSPKYWGSCW